MAIVKYFSICVREHEGRSLGTGQLYHIESKIRNCFNFVKKEIECLPFEGFAGVAAYLTMTAVMCRIDKLEYELGIFT